MFNARYLLAKALRNFHLLTGNNFISFIRIRNEVNLNIKSKLTTVMRAKM